MSLHPVTAASRTQALSLARKIAEKHPAYYDAVPPTYLALCVREIIRFCEDSGIWEPKDLSTIVLSMFAPSPSCLSENDREYAIQVITNVKAGAEARARSVAQALTGASPPPREPSGSR